MIIYDFNISDADFDFHCKNKTRVGLICLHILLKSFLFHVDIVDIFCFVSEYKQESCTYRGRSVTKAKPYECGKYHSFVRFPKWMW